MKTLAPHLVRLLVDRDPELDPNDWCPPLDRRAAVRLLSFSALASVVGCGSAGTTVSSTKADTSTGTTSTTTVLTASSTSVTAGTSVILTAVVSPTAATGTVTFFNASTSLGSSTLSSGKATLATSFSASGTETLQAIYSGDTSYASSTSATVTVTVTGTAACSVTLEGEEGPYFVDDSATGYNRSNILSNLDGTETQTGIAFTLTLYVYDAKNSCGPMQNVQVDIWHCNTAGVYSAESSEATATKSWLRGYQLTDATGLVTFSTILPGWYSGRTTHIHLRLRSTYDTSTSSGSNTVQMFFDQTLLDTLDTSVTPYSSEGKNPTTNASDRVYSQEEDGTTLMSLTGSNTAGYAATAKIYLPITS